MLNNVGPLDQWMRITIGILAGLEFFYQPTNHHWWLILFSTFFFLSGMLGSCPIYTLFGGSTKPSTGHPRSVSDQAGRRNITEPKG
jgi:hypothetical protein